jgi:hypothetical protein
MSKLIGDEKTWDRIRSAKPGDPACYVNMEAIESLPEQFSAKPVTVEFDIEEHFTNVGTKQRPSYYPKPQFMYDIGEARGIGEYGDVTMEPIVESVDISLMEMADTPCPMNKKVGYQVKKSGSVVQEDGSLRTYQEIGINNAWDEAVKLWTKEELATEGYAKTTRDKYKRLGYETEWNGEKTWHECKYDTKYKRRAHFQELFDKSFGMARSDAWLKVIRVLACLKTGYTAEDLKEGKFYFCKIIKSESMLKAEGAARLAALSKGYGSNESPSASVFGEAPKKITKPVDPPMKPTEGTVTPAASTLKPANKSPRDELIAVLKSYQENGFIVDEMKGSTDALLSWLDGEKEPDKNAAYWGKAMGNLAKIEDKIPSELRIAHGLK